MATNNSVNTTMPATGGYARDIANLASATNGQIVMGSTGVAPVLGSISAGSGISITPGAGSISIAATGGGTTWTSLYAGSGSHTVGPNTGWIIGAFGGNITLNLDAGATWHNGDVVEIVGGKDTIMGFTWTLNVAGTIFMQYLADGSVSHITPASTATGASIRLVCDVGSPTVFLRVTSVTAGITLT